MDPHIRCLYHRLFHAVAYGIVVVIVVVIAVVIVVVVVVFVVVVVVDGVRSRKKFVFFNSWVVFSLFWSLCPPEKCNSKH